MSKYSKSDFITSCFLLDQYINQVLISRGWNFNYKNNNIITTKYMITTSVTDDCLIFQINRDKFFDNSHDEIKRSKIFISYQWN